MHFIPCYNTSHDLLLLFTQNVMEQTVATTLSRIYIEYISWTDWKGSSIQELCDLDKGRHVYVSQCTDWPCNRCQTGHHLLSNKHCDLTSPQHCNHSETDTPVYDTYDKTAYYNMFALLSELWLDFGKNYRDIPSTQILAR